MPAICPNGDKRSFCAGDTLTVIAAANARDPITVPETAFHREVRAELDTSFNRRFHQHLVELAPSRSISPSRISQPYVSSDQRKISEISAMGGKWRAVRTNDSVQKPPLGEPFRTVPVYEVSPVHITGNHTSVEKQDPVTVAG